MTGRARSFSSDESGATVVEHAILACVVALAIVGLVGSGLTPVSAFRGVAYIADVMLLGDDKASPSMPDAPGAGQ